MVPPQHGATVAPRHAATEAFDQGFTLQGVSVLLGLVVAVLTILGFMRKARRENEEDAAKRTQVITDRIDSYQKTTDDRIRDLEAKSADFMPRTEIEQKLDHEKSNRTMADNALKDRLDANTRDIVDIKVSVGRLDQKQDGMSSELHEMKSLIKDMSRDVNAKLDKQQECLNSISRRAA